MASGLQFQVGTGGNIKIYIAGLAQGATTAPTTLSETVTLSAAVTLNDTSITITAGLSELLPKGSILTFADGTNKSVIVSADAAAGATTINIIASPHATIAISSTATANYKILLTGTTDVSPDISSNTEQSVVHSDALGFQNKAVTSQNMTIPITANLLADDSGTNVLAEFAINAVTREVWFWVEEPAPALYTTGNVTDGRALVTNYSKALPADGILTYTATLDVQGSPNFSQPA